MKSAFKPRPIDPPESDIQRAVLHILDIHRDVAWAHRFNVGAHAYSQVDSKGRRKRRFMKYAFPGCSDILGQMKDGRFLAVEVKRRTGRLTREQRQFLDLVHDNGGIAFVARSAQDVIERLEQCPD